MGSQAVRLAEVTKRFPGVLANDAVDLEIEKGSVHALLGENGAGKTTLMNVLYGLYGPDGGAVYVDGQRRNFDSPREAIDAGVGMIHQHFMLVDPMTVVENVTLGYEPRTRFGVDRARAREEVVELADRYGFDVDPGAKIEDVSVGVQQRVEIVKALYRGAEVLILDEPTAVLTPQEVTDLFSVLSELTAEGKTILFITHKLGEAMRAADSITVLRDGRNVGTVRADDTTREELAELMVGREVVLDVERDPVTPGDVVLGVDSLRVRDGRETERVSEVSFEVREGEILGIAGVDGNGQSELIEAITGLRVPDAGGVSIDGTDVTQSSRGTHTDRGMAYVPEDRQDRGLVMDFDLVRNAALGSQHDPAFARNGRIDWEQVREHADSLIDAYDVRPPDPDAKAASLSGGNQQKFVVGRELERDPRVVIASHPTRGVDVGSTEFIHERLLELRREGVAVVLVSSKLDELRSLSDRLAVMYEGEFVDVVDPETTTEEEIGLLMAGERPEDTNSTERAAVSADGGERASGKRTGTDGTGGTDGSDGSGTR
jgi:simple sugar transport system ATP-binding protein